GCRRLSSVLAVGLVAGALGAHSVAADQTAGSLTLVRDRAANCVIVVGANAPNPTYSALPAARLLQRYLKNVSGADVPVISESALQPADANGKVLVLVGDGARVRSLKLSRQRLEPEGFLIQTSGSQLVILGGDEKGRRGTYYGALAFV